MRADELKAILNHRPFLPIRLLMSSGEHVDIRHPELALVSRALVAVAVGSPSAQEVADHIVHFNLLQLVKITPLIGRNGHARPRGRTRRSG